MGILAGPPFGFGGVALPDLALNSEGTSLQYNDTAFPWNANAALKLDTDGFIYTYAGDGAVSYTKLNSSTDWKRPTDSTVPVYWKASSTGDTLDSGTTDDTWRELTSDQEWKLSEGTQFASKSTALTLSLGFDGSTTEVSNVYNFSVSNDL